MGSTEDKVLNDFNDYLIMLSEMDKVGIRRKITLIEGYIHKIKNVIDTPKLVSKMIRLPNEDTYISLDVNMDEFVVHNEFENEIFGEYRGGMMFIQK